MIKQKKVSLVQRFKRTFVRKDFIIRNRQRKKLRKNNKKSIININNKSIRTLIQLFRKTINANRYEDSTNSSLYHNVLKKNKNDIFDYINISNIKLNNISSCYDRLLYNYNNLINSDIENNNYFHTKGWIKTYRRVDYIDSCIINYIKKYISIDDLYQIRNISHFFLSSINNNKIRNIKNEYSFLINKFKKYKYYNESILLLNKLINNKIPFKLILFINSCTKKLFILLINNINNYNYLYNQLSTNVYYIKSYSRVTLDKKSYRLQLRKDRFYNILTRNIVNGDNYYLTSYLDLFETDDEINLINPNEHHNKFNITYRNNYKVKKNNILDINTDNYITTGEFIDENDIRMSIMSKNYNIINNKLSNEDNHSFFFIQNLFLLNLRYNFIHKYLNIYNESNLNMQSSYTNDVIFTLGLKDVIKQYLNQLYYNIEYFIFIMLFLNNQHKYNLKYFKNVGNIFKDLFKYSSNIRTIKSFLIDTKYLTKFNIFLNVKLYNEIISFYYSVKRKVNRITVMYVSERAKMLLYNKMFMRSILEQYLNLTYLKLKNNIEYSISNYLNQNVHLSINYQIEKNKRRTRFVLLDKYRLTGKDKFISKQQNLTRFPPMISSKQVCEFVLFKLEKRRTTFWNCFKEVKWWQILEQRKINTAIYRSRKSINYNDLIKKYPMNGIRILISGPRRKAKRKKKTHYHLSIRNYNLTKNMPLQTTRTNIDFYQTQAIRPGYSCGIKVWLLFNTISYSVSNKIYYSYIN